MSKQPRITSRELINRCGQDPDEPLGRIEFPAEMRMRPATDEEAQRGLNDTWPGDPVPASPTVDDELVARLRQGVIIMGFGPQQGEMVDIVSANQAMRKAADRITDLQARLERYRMLMRERDAVAGWHDVEAVVGFYKRWDEALSDSTEGDPK